MDKMKDVESAQAKRVKKRKTLENWLLGIGIFCIATVVLIVVGIVCFWLYRRSRKKDSKDSGIYEIIEQDPIGEGEDPEEEEGELTFKEMLKRRF